MYGRGVADDEVGPVVCMQTTEGNRRREATTTMDRQTKKFIKQARHECRLLEQGYTGFEEAPTKEEEMEVIVRAGVGGSANLGFFLPYLWRHRHA